MTLSRREASETMRNGARMARCHIALILERGDVLFYSAWQIGGRGECYAMEPNWRNLSALTLQRRVMRFCYRHVQEDTRNRGATSLVIEKPEWRNL